LSASVRGWSWWKLLTWLLGTSQISRWLVRVTGADAPRVEGVAPLPRRAAHGFVSHDHTVPAVPVDLADPLDDPAPPPPTANAYPYGGVARGGAALLPGDARACAPGVRDGIAHHAQYANLCSESRVLAQSWVACRITARAGTVQLLGGGPAAHGVHLQTSSPPAPRANWTLLP